MMLSPRLWIEELKLEHLAELATHLRRSEVYEHIGGVPSLEDFVRDREIALQGPGSAAPTERWLNFLVRERASHRMVGRLEATLHDSIAEVAFLFAPSYWGRGFAREALSWLHQEICQTHRINHFWGTTVPANLRCQALLLRCGYHDVQSDPSGPGLPRLYSFDQGDLVFHKVEPL